LQYLSKLLFNEVRISNLTAIKEDHDFSPNRPL
jgi:hypothetical protein